MDFGIGPRSSRRRCRRSGHIFVDLDKVSVDVVDVQEVGRVQRDGLVAKRRIVIHHDEVITSRLNVCQKKLSVWRRESPVADTSRRLDVRRR